MPQNRAQIGPGGGQEKKTKNNDSSAIQVDFAPMEALNKNNFKKYQNYKAHGTQIVTRNLQNGAPKPPTSRPKPSQIEPKLGQEGSRMTNKSENNTDPTKKRRVPHSVAPFWRKMWPTWRQVGSQNRAKIDKKSKQKSIKKQMPSKIDV